MKGSGILCGKELLIDRYRYLVTFLHMELIMYESQYDYIKEIHDINKIILKEIENLNDKLILEVTKKILLNKKLLYIGNKYEEITLSKKRIRNIVTVLNVIEEKYPKIKKLEVPYKDDERIKKQLNYLNTTIEEIIAETEGTVSGGGPSPSSPNNNLEELLEITSPKRLDALLVRDTRGHKFPKSISSQEALKGGSSEKKRKTKTSTSSKK